MRNWCEPGFTNGSPGQTARASTRPSQYPSPSPTSSMCHRARSVSLGGFKGIPRPWEIGPVPVHSPPHQTARAKIPARASTDTHTPPCPTISTCRRAAGTSPSPNRAWESRRLPSGSVGGDTALDQSGATVHEPLLFYIVDLKESFMLSYTGVATNTIYTKTMNICAY